MSKTLLTLLLSIITASVASAETREVNVSRQFGLGYLQFMIMEQHKLIEKQVSAAGLPDVKVNWMTLANGAVQNDALLSNSIQVAAGGVGAFVTLWDKTRTSLGVKGIASLISAPAVLNVRDPVKTIDDLKATDRIAVLGPKVSTPAITLQMAAAQKFGFANYDKLDRLTVNLSHPLALQAMMSGSTQIVGHFATLPYSFIELKDPTIKTVLNSYDVWGGKQTLLMAWTSSKFHQDNPKTYAAVAAAIEEATQWINTNQTAAAQLYLDISKDRLSLQDVVSILKDPQNEFTVTPLNLVKFAMFKHKIGTLKNAPDGWKDMFFPNTHHLGGS